MSRQNYNVKRYTHPCVPSSTTHNSQPRHGNNPKVLDKEDSIHTMEYSSVIKKNKRLPFAVTWMQLEIPTLSEVRKRETDST